MIRFPTSTAIRPAAVQPVAAPPPARPLFPDAFAARTYTVVAGDSYYAIAQRQATAQLAARGLSPSDPSYSAEWHQLTVTLVNQLRTSNGNRALHPGDQLLLDATQAAPPPVVTPTGPGKLDFINQFVGDPDGRNGNCGFTSSLMALRLLGIESSALTGSNYAQAMTLRRLGGAGTNDRSWGTVTQVVRALTAAGAHAAALPNTWGTNKLGAVEAMRQAFLSGQPTAFVCAGNPALGWPGVSAYSGGHFVTVAGYDAATGRFTVLDPLARGPIQVTGEQLAAYLRDTNAENGEVVQVRP